LAAVVLAQQLTSKAETVPIQFFLPLHQLVVVVVVLPLQALQMLMEPQADQAAAVHTSTVQVEPVLQAKVLLVVQLQAMEPQAVVVQE
jgi:hypothetical protein